MIYYVSFFYAISIIINTFSQVATPPVIYAPRPEATFRRLRNAPAAPQKVGLREVILLLLL